MGFYFFQITFFTTDNDEKFKAWKRYKKIEDNIIEDVRNLLKTKKKETDETTVKDMRNISVDWNKNMKELKIQ